jgi:hypothetical protein
MPDFNPSLFLKPHGTPVNARLLSALHESRIKTFKAFQI